MEDALKHCYDCEEKGVGCSLHSLAGALGTSADGAARIVHRLEKSGLLRTSGSALQLTPEGRSGALRVIRVHRLWEYHLADETSLHETEWHTEAELQEHRMSPEEVERLAARMGNPGFDPHGDPIPSVRGEMPRRPGIPLTDLPEGAGGRIVHLEDEPPAIYARLVGLGLYPGMPIRMIGAGRGEVRVAADGEERVLRSTEARNVTVAPLTGMAPTASPRRTLDMLRQGETARVRGISEALRGQQRRRLMDMGIVSGTPITAELVSLGGDPTAYRVRGTLVALRRKQSEQVFIEHAGGTE
jgi:DtxR family Mn-dependent transcriptional regulator